MAEFVDTSLGLINVAHIIRVWPAAGPALRNETDEAAIDPRDSGIQLADGRVLTCLIVGSVEWPGAPGAPPLVGFGEGEC